MKKIIIILIAAFSVIDATAQDVQTIVLTAYKGNFTKYTGAAGDTTVNTDTSYLYTVSPVNQFGDLIWKVTNTKVSGTVAGTIVFQCSSDGTASGVWNTMKTDKTLCPFLTDTVTATDGNTAFNYLMPAHPLLYYRARIITSGTQKSVMTGSLNIRRRSAIGK